MSGNEINRRDFFMIMAWGGSAVALACCDMPSTRTLEDGQEEVSAYLLPEEYVIPGIAVFYASTSQQCPAGCATHNRVREGRELKVEGNPESSLNYGKVCQKGQAGLQQLYNPDRLTKPLIRKGGALVEASWDEAMEAIKQHGGPGAAGGVRFAGMTGTMSGLQAVLLQAHLDAVGSHKHFAHEVVNDAVSQAVNRVLLGEAQPRYRVDQARVILSLGTDFLGASISPVHFATQYAKCRGGGRGGRGRGE